MQSTLKIADANQARSPKFEDLNSYSHKRRTVNIGNPAIVWHRAYWRPREMSTKAWHAGVNKYVTATFNQLRDGGHQPNWGGSRGGDYGESAPPDPQYDAPKGKDLSAHSIEFLHHTARISIVFEKFDEFWAIKTIVDYSRVSNSSALEDCFFKLYLGLVFCEDVIIGRAQLHGNVSSKERLVRHQSEIISAALVDLVGLIFPAECRSGTDPSIIGLDDMFANFVGFSLGADLSGPATSWSDVTRLAAPEEKRPVDERRLVAENVSPEKKFPSEPEKLAEIVDTIWPVARWLNPYMAFDDNGVLKKAPPPERPSKISREFTISLLNRGRALYVSSLGGMRAPIRSDPAEQIYFPLSYLMICPHKATWQIGRIIDRIHTLGLFRLATLWDYDDIEKSDREMGDLVNEVNKDDADIRDISRRFDGLSPSIPNGLNYRVEWSKYYMSLFQGTMETLHFDRVEGFQTYPEFISRKFSGRFKTIDSVSSRFDYLSRQIRTKTNQRTEKTIAELLVTAEIISVVPISYYVFHVLDIMNDSLLDVTGGGWLPAWPKPALWLSLSLSIAYVFWLFNKNRKRKGVKAISLPWLLDSLSSGPSGKKPPWRASAQLTEIRGEDQN